MTSQREDLFRHSYSFIPSLQMFSSSSSSSHFPSSSSTPSPSFVVSSAALPSPSSSSLLLNSSVDDLAALASAAAEEEDAEKALLRTLSGALVLGAAMAGVFANLFVLSLSLLSIRGDYRLFIANLALVDAGCALLFAFMGLLWTIGRPFQRQLPLWVLTQSALCFYGSFGVLVAALLPVSFSRIVAAFRPKSYERLFSGWRAPLFCLCADFIPLALLFALSRRHSLFFLYASLTIVAYALAFLLNLAVFRFVAKHIRVVQSLQDRTRLAETRQVALATLLQALVPLLCQVPAFLALSSALLLIRPPSSATLIWLTQFWLAASPLLDAILTLLIIKPYRMKSKAILGKLWSSVVVIRKVAGVKLMRRRGEEELDEEEDNAKGAIEEVEEEEMML